MDEKTIINKTVESQINPASKSINFLDESSEESFHRANFEKFLENFRNKNFFAGASWNKLRETTYKEQQNRRKIVLKEIDQLDSKDPLNIINEDYLKDHYSQHLLSNELKAFDNLLNENINMKLLEKRENLEMIKKIIDYYLIYAVDLNFDSIMKSLKKMNLIETNITTSLCKIGSVKHKISSIKQYLLFNSAKLLLFKNKLKNLQKMQLILKDYIQYWAGLFKSIKGLKKDENIALIYDILQHISFGIKRFFNNQELKEIFGMTNFFKYSKHENKSIVNATNLNGNGKIEGQNKSFKIIDIFYLKCEKKLNKLSLNLNKNFTNLFKQRKANYMNFFYYQLSNGKGDIANFAKIFLTNFKSNIIETVKSSLANFNDESRAAAIREIVRLRDLSTIKYEENRLTQGINAMMRSLSELLKNFDFYLQSHQKLQENENYLNIFENDLEVLKEKKKFHEIERKKMQSLSGASEVINNLYKRTETEAADFSDILTLKIKYFNSISEYLKTGNPKFLEYIKQRFLVFFSLLEKKTAKVLVVYRHVFKEMNIKNLICNMIYYNLHLRKIQAYFKTDVSKYIVKQMNEIVLENLKFNNLQAIRKIGILLSGDNWKRVALQDDHEFISLQKLEEKIPFTLTALLPLFKPNSNPKSSLIQSENLANSFSSLLELINQNSNTNFSKANFLDNQDPDFFKELKNLQILSKKLNNKNFIISSSSTTLIRSLMDLVTYILFFDTLTYEVFLQIFNLFDYFIIATLFMFTDKKIISCLFEDINTEDLRKKGKIDYAIEMVLFQKRYCNLRKFINSAKQNFENLFEKQIDLIKNNYESETYENAFEFYLPKLNSEINLLDSNIYAGMIENIVLFESIHSIYRILKRLKHYTNNIDFDIKQREIDKKFELYKSTLTEMKMFFYKPICNNIFKIDSIMNKINNFKWDLKDNESDSQFNEASPFIDNIFQEICEKYDKLFLLSAGSLTQKSQKRFLEVMLVYFAEKLLDSFSKIKKCSSCGRSIMLKDIKFLKSKIEAKFNFECQNFFSDLEIFVNSWYNEEEEFIKFISESHINYKYINGLFNTAQNIVKMTKQQRKDYNQKVEDTYIQMIEDIKTKILSE